MTQQDYWLKPNETIDAYNTRIASLRGETAPTVPQTLPTPSLTKPPTATAIGQNKAIVSSDLARGQYNQNIEALPKMEGQFAQQPQQTYEVKAGDTLSEIAQQFGVDVKDISGYRSGDPDLIYPGEKLVIGKQIQPTQGAITYKSDNPAFQSLISQTNNLIGEAEKSGVPLTPEANNLLNQINNFQNKKTSAIADARDAADEKDATKLNESIEKAKEADTAAKTALETLLEERRTARESYISALKPTDKEMKLKQDLITLRTERQLLPLELRQEGISAAGIAGRQVEDERVRAIQEQNLLLEIGLEQESRQFAELSAEKQLGFINEDIELQNKIQEKLDKDEKEALDAARDLRKDSLTAMSDILESFEGLAWTDLDPQSQADLAEKAKEFDIPLNLLTSAMKNTKQQQVFENALKTTEEARKAAQEERLRKAEESTAEKTKRIVLTPENRKDLAGIGFNPQDISDIEKSVNDFGIKTTLQSIDDENKRRVVAEKYNAQTILEKIESEKEAETTPATTKRWWQFWK